MHLPIKRQASTKIGTWKRSKINAQKPRTSSVEDEVSPDAAHPGFSLWSSSSEDECEDGQAIDIRDTDDQYLLSVDSLHVDTPPVKTRSYTLTKANYAIFSSTVGKSISCPDLSNAESAKLLHEKPRRQQKTKRLQLPKQALEHIDANETEKAISEWLRLSEDVGCNYDLANPIQAKNTRQMERRLKPPSSPLDMHPKARAYSEPAQIPFPKRTTHATSQVPTTTLLRSTDASASEGIGSYIERELRLRDEKVDTLQAIVDEKHRDIAAGEENLHQLNLSLDRLCKQHNELIEDCREKEYHARRLRDRISEIEGRSQDYWALLCEANAETCELRASLEESQTEIARLKQDLLAKSRGLDQLQGDLNSRSCELDELCHQQALQQEKMSKVASEVDNRNIELKKCQAELFEVKSSSKTMQSVADELRKELDAKSGHIDQLKAQNTENSRGLVQYRNENAELLGRTRRSDDHIQELQQLKEANDSRISGLISELGTKSGAFRTSCERISRLESQIDTGTLILRQMEEGKKTALDQECQLQRRLGEVCHEHNQSLEVWKRDKFHLQKELESWKGKFRSQGQIDVRYLQDTVRLEHLSRQNGILNRYEAGTGHINSMGTDNTQDLSGRNRERVHGLPRIGIMTDNPVDKNEIPHTPQPRETLSSKIQAAHPRPISHQGAASVQSVAQAASVTSSRQAPDVHVWKAPSSKIHQLRTAPAPEKCTASPTVSNPQFDLQKSREDPTQLPRPDPQVLRNEDARWDWRPPPEPPQLRRILAHQGGTGNPPDIAQGIQEPWIVVESASFRP
ncbi:MAG: hypothetical protein Q9165_005563 [Trypethelium subeluteriae]